MEGTLKLWVVILAVGALNYASRLSFIALFTRVSMPPLLARALRYVPPAMLMALIVPMVAAGATPEAFNPKIPAAVIAAVVAWFTRSSLKTMVAGMASLWLLQAALSRMG